jgi:predicted O-methyltransferase YrrM
MPSFQEIDIQLTNEDRETIKEHVKKITPPNCYVEIGVHEGGSALMALEVASPDVGLYGIDKEDKFKARNTRINFINKISLEATEDWNKPIGVLFIDGDHDEAGQDFRAWERFVIPNGIILFHDYARHSPEVIKDCEEIIKNPNYELLFRPKIGQSLTSIFQIKKITSK